VSFQFGNVFFVVVTLAFVDDEGGDFGQWFYFVICFLEGFGDGCGKGFFLRERLKGSSPDFTEEPGVETHADAEDDNDPFGYDGVADATGPAVEEAADDAFALAEDGVVGEGGSEEEWGEDVETDCSDGRVGC
jgi:hypothetical protein